MTEILKLECDILNAESSIIELQIRIPYLSEKAAKMLMQYQENLPKMKAKLKALRAEARLQYRAGKQARQARQNVINMVKSPIDPKVQAAFEARLWPDTWPDDEAEYKVLLIN